MKRIYNIRVELCAIVLILSSFLLRSAEEPPTKRTRISIPELLSASPASSLINRSLLSPQERVPSESFAVNNKADLRIFINYPLLNDKFEIITWNFICALKSPISPILIPEALFYNFMRYPQDKALLDSYIFYKIDNFLLLIPINYPIKIEDIFLVTLSQLVSYTHYMNINSPNELDEWRKTILIAPQAFLEMQKKLFTKNEAYFWNITIDGHGDTTQIAGIVIDEFKKYLDFLKFNLHVDTLIITSCFSMAHEDELYTYKNNNYLIHETYPFTILTNAIGNTTISSPNYYNDTGRLVCIYDYKKLFEELNKNIFTHDFYSILNQSNFMSEAFKTNLWQIRPKNSFKFLPLVPYKNLLVSHTETEPQDRADVKNTVAITEVLAQAKKNIIFNSPTTMILLYPRYFKGTLRFDEFVDDNNEFRVHIVSMEKNKPVHSIDTLEFTKFFYANSNPFNYFCTLFAPPYKIQRPEYFYIKNVQFETPQTIHFPDINISATVQNISDVFVVLTQKDSTIFSPNQVQIFFTFALFPNEQPFFAKIAYEYEQYSSFLNTNEANDPQAYIAIQSRLLAENYKPTLQQIVQQTYNSAI